MKEKNTMKDNNMNIMEQIILREVPDSNSKSKIMNYAKNEYNKLYAELLKVPARTGDKRTERLGLMYVIYNAYKSGYRVKNELDLDKGPIDLELQRIENDQLKIHRIDVKSIHPNAKVKRLGGTEPNFKARSTPRKEINETVEEMNKKHFIYQRKIAIIYKGKCVIREGWHRQTNKKELKVFDHDTSQKIGFIK